MYMFVRTSVIAEKGIDVGRFLRYTLLVYLDSQGNSSVPETIVTSGAAARTAPGWATGGYRIHTGGWLAV